ncbi:hypothetical protein [Halobacillus kuroshimensis]|uniref:hypothetical protein n=1 Tax=Halobacillus kuroshimensis TaxID=302481 RepID=UPI00041673E7|nr:hypothetical protein [Halobacillus kuroshimensis]
MTAIIGFLFGDGVFVSADTRRLSDGEKDKYKNSVKEKFEKYYARKIHKLTDTKALAVAGNPGDIGPIQEIQWKIHNNYNKNDTTNLIIDTFKKYDHTRIINEMLLFGLDNEKSFMIDIDANLNVKECHSSNVKGIPEKEFEITAQAELESATHNHELVLDIWAQLTFNKIISKSLPKLARIHGVTKHDLQKSLASVDFPIDIVIIKNNGKGFMWNGVDTRGLSEENIDLFEGGRELGEILDKRFTIKI